MEKEKLLKQAHAYFMALEGKIPEENGYPAFCVSGFAEITFAVDNNTLEAFKLYRKKDEQKDYAILLLLGAILLASGFFLFQDEIRNSFRALFIGILPVLACICFYAYQKHKLKKLFKGKIIRFRCWDSTIECRRF